MIKKILIFLLLALLFTITWAKISNTFDGDLGWHLRFGQDAAQRNFQYTDSYTWKNYGVAWVNHEWAGDIFFWQIYDHLGYYWLVIITSLAVTTSFYLSTKIFGHKTTIPGLIIATVLLHSVTHILVMRLAMFAFLFFTLLWLTLEKIPKKKYYYLWPLLFWLWSITHGSWTLGFITINIYLGANLIQLIAHKYYPKLPATNWHAKDFFSVIEAQIISGLTILINPYGYKIYTEVLAYFTQSYYKTHITEWVASYVYPIFWPTLIIATVTLFFAILLFKNKKINFAQMLLILAFFISSFSYKRNAAFSALVSVPFLILTYDWAKEIISQQRPDLIKLFNEKIVKNILIFCIAALLILLGFYSLRIKIYSTPWNQREILTKNLMPYDAVQFLKKETAGKPYKIFNEFSWGGYMNWELRDSLIFFDGRGTATWMSPETPNRSMLEEYYNYKYGEGYLEKIEKSGSTYIILQNNNFIPYPPPDTVNRFLFGDKLNKIYHPEIPRLETDLRNSSNWQLIYSDYAANIWKNLTVR